MKREKYQKTRNYKKKTTERGKCCRRKFTGADISEFYLQCSGAPSCAFVSSNVVIDVTQCNFPISIHLQPDPQANQYDWSGPAN
jgi:hypothetical protein